MLNKWKTREEVNRIKEEYPVGTMIEMVYMDDIQAIPPGTKGIIENVDDQGQLHMEWENGRRLAIVPDVDQFNVLRKPIQVLIVPPNEKPYTENIYEDLNVMQEIVGGNIQYVNIEDDVVLICNEGGKIFGLTPNRSIDHDIICGTFFIAGSDDSEYLISLTEEQIEKYQERFMEIEELSEVELVGLSYFKM